MVDTSEHDFDWARSLRREDWETRMLARTAWREGGTVRNEAKLWLPHKLASKRQWDAVISDAERHMSCAVSKGGLLPVDFVNQFVAVHCGNNGDFFPGNLLQESLLAQHCPHRIEIKNSLTIRLEIVDFAQEYGLVGLFCIAQSWPTAVLHCSDAVAAVTLRLRFG